MDRSMKSRNQTIIALQEHIFHACSLMKAKALTDTSAPRCFTPNHNPLRGKAAYFEKNRNRKIETENTRLCFKIKKEMHRRKYYAKRPTLRSLNGKRRLEEHQRIQTENKKMFESLAKTQPSISMYELKKSYKENERRRSNLLQTNPKNLIWNKFNNRIAYSATRRHSIYKTKSLLH